MGLGHSYWYLGVLAIITSCIATQHHPHQPFQWSLMRAEDTTMIQQIITAGAPSFKTDLCKITTVKPCNNRSDFYLCPGSHPGKSYCNAPTQYFCASWGCETIASAWNPGGGKDKYLAVQFGPKGCVNHRVTRWIRGVPLVRGNCTFLWINVTNPTDQGWIFGKTWGIRYYEHGSDRGGFILIKKNRPPEAPRPVGSNRSLGPLNTVPRFTQSNKSISTIETAPPLAQFPSVTEGDMIAPINGMWKVINASFQVLNQTNLDITRGCWLCVDIRPPYYEAVGDMGTPEYSNETSPYKCSWRQEIGITLTQVTGKGRCVGTVPNGKRNLCNITENGHQSHNWLIPAKNTRWVCSSLGITPCLSLKLFNSSHDFCVQVVIIPRILYHSEEYMYVQRAMAKNRFRKREPITAVTLATLMILGAAGAGTGITSLVKQSQEFTSLRIAVDEDLAHIEQSISALEKSVQSLSEVVLQNRRGLDLTFLQQGGLCAAL